MADALSEILKGPGAFALRTLKAFRANQGLLLAGAVKGGRNVTYPEGTPLTNLYLTLLDRMGVHAGSIGDSNGKLEL